MNILPNMNISKPHQQDNTLEDHRNFLYIIIIIAFVTGLFEAALIIFFSSYPDSTIRKTMRIISFSIIGLIIVLGFSTIMASDPSHDITSAVNIVLSKINAGIAVTIVFFAFIMNNILFIMQDGGAPNSCISSILLINASFGFYFAEKKHIKNWVLIASLGGYLFCSIIYLSTTENTFIFSFVKAIPHFLMAAFTLFINVVIEYQHKKNFLKNR